MIKQLLQLAQNSPLKNYTSTNDWSTAYYQLVSDKLPIEKAILGGFSCQQFSFAFMAGYQAALEYMFPTVAPNELKALCVSEEKGGHPKAIQTTLIDNHLNGLKTYITAGSDVEHLLILCKTDKIVNNRPQLKMVHIPKGAENTELMNFELSFMKEVKHGKLAMTNTPIIASQVLEGDGFSDYAKPFRTLEDICVGAAYQSMLFRQAIDHQWAENLRDQLLFNLFTFTNLLPLPLLDQNTHILLAALDNNFESILPNIESTIEATSSATFKTDWAMNKKLIGLGNKTKAARLEKARRLVFG